MRPVTCRSGMSRRPTTVVKTEPPEDDDVKPPTPALSPQAQSFDLDRSFLSCAVCLEILHNPVNVNPCNHKFCGRCIFQWLDRNEACPKCRNKVEDVTEDGFAADICKEFLRSYPDHCRSQEVEKDVDKNELEYLEKLEDRLNNPRRVFEWEIMDPDLRLTIRMPASRKLRLVPSRFRDQQWKERIRRLRQQLQLPPRAVAPPPGRPIPETNGRIIPNLPRNSDQNRYNGVLPVTVNRRLSYPNRGRIASPPRNLTRAERYQRRERRSQRAEREDSPIHGIPAPFSPLPIGFNDLLRMAYDEEDFDSDDGLPFF